MVCCACVHTCPCIIPIIGKAGDASIDNAGGQGRDYRTAECPGKVIALNQVTDRQLIAKTVAPFTECASWAGRLTA